MLSCSIWFSAPTLWMDGGLGSRCLDRVYGADGAVHGMSVNIYRTTRRLRSQNQAKFLFIEVL